MSDWQLALLLVAGVAGHCVGYWWRHRKAIKDQFRLCSYYEGLLKATLLEQHIYLDPPATIYIAVKDRLVYVGQTTQELYKRVKQHERGTSGFDRIYGRDPESWQWLVREIVPITYRYAAERAWIQYYIDQGWTLMNGNNGTDDGLTWSIE